jgi:hypothetical protein
MSAFGMFSLTKREQRVVIVILLALIAIALVRRYHDLGTIIPSQTTRLPKVNATPSSLTEDEGSAHENPR